MAGDPVSLPESMNAALGQLHLEDAIESKPDKTTVEPGVPLGDKNAIPIDQRQQQQNVPLGFIGDPQIPGNHGPMFAPHMMNPFMPYHPMMAMPHSGFFPGSQEQMFPPPDSSAAVDFTPAPGPGQHIDLSMSHAPGAMPSAGGVSGSLAEPTSEATTTVTSSVGPGANMRFSQQQFLGHGQTPMFWMNADELNSSAIDDTGIAEDSGTNRDAFVRGSSFTMQTSDSQESGADMKIPGANNSRRQTFHAVSATDLLNESTSTPTVAASGAVSSNSASNEKDIGKKEPQQRVYPHAAAYPYSGTLLQPNPVLSGHPLNHPHSHPAHPIGSPFPGYGFSTAFSPVPAPGTPLNGMNSPQLNSEESDVVKLELGTQQKLGSIHSGSNSPASNQSGAHVMSGINPWMFAPPHGSPNFLIHHPHPHHSGPSGSHSGHQRSPSNNSQHRRRHFNNNGSSRNSNYNGKQNPNSHRYDDGARYQDSELKEFIGNIYSLCKDQHGCRFLQKKLDEDGVKAASTIYGEVKDHVCELMNDPFGNYLMQKLIERVEEADRIEIVKNCSLQAMDIALDAHGTRALQKLVECISTKEETSMLVSSLKPSILTLSRDFKSNHVVQKMLEKFSSEDTQFIYDVACEDIIKISNHRNGCCVVQRCLDFGSPQQLDALCETIVNKSFELTMNPYGNYVIQYILTKEKQEKDSDFRYTTRIVDVLKLNAIELSLNKFASNVIESILRTPAVSEIMINKILDNDDRSGLVKLLHDSYGNYVLQTALDVLKDSNQTLFGLMSNSLKPLLVGQIRNTPHGRRIASLIQTD